MFPLFLDGKFPEYAFVKDLLTGVGALLSGLGAFISEFGTYQSTAGYSPPSSSFGLSGLVPRRSHSVSHSPQLHARPAYHVASQGPTAGSVAGLLSSGLRARHGLQHSSLTLSLSTPAGHHALAKGPRFSAFDQRTSLESTATQFVVSPNRGEVKPDSGPALNRNIVVAMQDRGIQALPLRKSESFFGVLPPPITTTTSTSTTGYRSHSLNGAAGLDSYDFRQQPSTSRLDLGPFKRDGDVIGKHGTRDIARKLSAPSYDVSSQGQWPGIDQRNVLHPPLGIRVSRSSPTALTSVEEVMGMMSTRQFSVPPNDAQKNQSFPCSSDRSSALCGAPHNVSAAFSSSNEWHLRVFLPFKFKARAFL